MATVVEHNEENETCLQCGICFCERCLVRQIVKRAGQSRVGIVLEERCIPLGEHVQGACEFWGSIRCT